MPWGTSHFPVFFRKESEKALEFRKLEKECLGLGTRPWRIQCYGHLGNGPFWRGGPCGQKPDHVMGNWIWGNKLNHEENYVCFCIWYQKEYTWRGRHFNPTVLTILSSDPFSWAPYTSFILGAKLMKCPSAACPWEHFLSTPCWPLFLAFPLLSNSFFSGSPRQGSFSLQTPLLLSPPLPPHARASFLVQYPGNPHRLSGTCSEEEECFSFSWPKLPPNPFPSYWIPHAFLGCPTRLPWLN